ncbi:Ubiquitinyl hydrolase 1 [Handroanthus impetiginosus]|uniref:Ubiquitinyl hydrolase 1 n=1 Tax=Handroanthus impetiginosus TaxID=429701 RepID=A0A2G9H745_9LAMI|nr:Ubiquitinyl hydrolase 1 [Handroanthus impetiginosus]
MVQNEFLHDIAFNPSRQVKSWKRRKTCNSEVCIKGEETCEFYEKFKEVVELEYPGRHEKKVVLFNCEWFDFLSRQGIRIHKEYGIVDIKQNTRYPNVNEIIDIDHIGDLVDSSQPHEQVNVSQLQVMVEEEDDDEEKEEDSNGEENDMESEFSDDNLTSEEGDDYIVDDDSDDEENSATGDNEDTED